MSLEMAPLDKSHTSSYSSSVVTMALSCIVSEIKRDIWSKIAIFHTPYTQAPPPRRGKQAANVLRSFVHYQGKWSECDAKLGKVQPASRCTNVTDDRQTDRRHCDDNSRT